MREMQSYRDQSEVQLEELQRQLRRELFDLRQGGGVSGNIDRPHRVRQARQKIARVLTALNEKRRQVNGGIVD